MEPQFASPADKPFRFLDLPTKIRNRIYNLASVSDVPVMMAHLPAKWQHIDSDQPLMIIMEGSRPKLRELYTTHEERGGGAQANRYALLLVSRQVHQESTQIIHGNTMLNLMFLECPTSTWKMNLLAARWKDRLQHIRHLEISAEAGWIMLFRPAIALSGDDPDRPSLQALCRARTRLYNLHSITLYAWKEAEPEGFEMAKTLATPEERNILHRMFPQIGDIILRNGYGSERFSRRSDSTWELAYSREVLPEGIQLDTDLSLYDLENAASVGTDADTRLLNSQALYLLDIIFKRERARKEQEDEDLMSAVLATYD